MTSRFRPCSHTDTAGELLLVEGQSALHAVDQVRHRPTQAVLALQGKIPNAATRPARTIDRHTQCQQLFDTLGCGTGSDCDPDALRYTSVAILSDPDIDGAHSRYLLLMLFQHYLQRVVQAGKLRLVLCPLFRLESAGDNARHYFWSSAEKREFLDAHPAFTAGNLTVFKGLGSLTGAELARLVVAPDTRYEVDLYNAEASAVKPCKSPHP